MARRSGDLWGRAGRERYPSVGPPVALTRIFHITREICGQTAVPADPNQELAALRAENANLNERLEVVEHFCAVLHESLNAGENLPPAEGQGEADFVAIRAGMVELNRKLEAAEKKGKGREAALAARDHKIVEMETRLAAKAGDKGSAPAPATAAAATPPPAPGAPKLMKFEAKVEAEVKAGEKPQIPASGVEESILGRGICDALATFWT